MAFITATLIINYYYALLERKYILTNARTQSSSPQDKNIAPVYDDYSILFDTCDKYNRRPATAPALASLEEGVSC